jgi:hypothetical protein
MNHIIDFPLSDGCDQLWLEINQDTNMSHFILLKKKSNKAPVLAVIFAKKFGGCIDCPLILFRIDIHSSYQHVRNPFYQVSELGHGCRWHPMVKQMAKQRDSNRQYKYFTVYILIITNTTGLSCYPSQKLHIAIQSRLHTL